MIRRTVAEGHQLVTQAVHAGVSAELASHFGNGRFARPARRELVLTAVRMHDDGWTAIDTAGDLLDSAGQPLDMFDAPPEVSLSAWRDSANAAEAADPYAGLLVSLHVLQLCIRLSPDPAPGLTGADPLHLSRRFLLNKFHHREVERQEQLRTRLQFRTDRPLVHGLSDPGISAEEDSLAFSLRLLQACDAASLILCGASPEKLVGVRLQPAPGANPARARFERDGRDAVRLKPWPFDVSRFDIPVPVRVLREARFRSAEEMARAWADTSPKFMTASLAAG